MTARALVCLMAVFVIGAVSADEQVELMERLVAAQKDISTVQGEFSQATIRPDEPAASQANFIIQFAIRAPDCYSFTYTKPGDAEWRLRTCSDGKTTWTIEQMMAGEKPDVSSKPVDPKGNDPFRRIADFFPLTEAKLTHDFAVHINAIQNAYLVDLHPADPDVAEQLTQIDLILDEKFRLRELTVEEASGNRTLIVVGKAEYNQPIPDDQFTYQQPKP